MNISISLSATLMAATLLAALVLRRRRATPDSLVTPWRVLMLGTFLAVLVLLLGVYRRYSFSEEILLLPSPANVLFSLYQSMRVFTANSDLLHVQTVLTSADSRLMTWGTFYAAALFLWAPLLSISALLLFFTNFSSYLRFLWGYQRDVYIFSSLSEKSITLAESIAQSETGSAPPLFLFTNVKKRDNQAHQALLCRARNLNACCFWRECWQIFLSHHSKNSKLTFFALEDSEADNIKTGLALIPTYCTRKNTVLYVVAESQVAETVLNSTLDKAIQTQRPKEPTVKSQAGQAPDKSAEKENQSMQIRCVNEARSLVYHLLFQMALKGPSLFQTAVPRSDGVKEISALVVGLGRQGSQMVRALSWFCQMLDYSVSIHVFDRDQQALDRFAAQCPAMLAYSTKENASEGDARCMVTLHPAVDVNSPKFAAALRDIPHLGYGFVSLGDDDVNIQTAMDLRTLCRTPILQAVVYDPERCQAMSGIINHKNQPYDIDCVGSLTAQYSEQSFCHSALEKLALKLHVEHYGGTVDKFYRYEYNYRSSLASVLHHYARRSCGQLVGMEPLNACCQARGIPPSEGDTLLARLEHCRWNAYMRSEGYQFGDQDDHLAKLHHDLKDWNDLDKTERKKDLEIIDVDRFILAHEGLYVKYHRERPFVPQKHTIRRYENPKP